MAEKKAPTKRKKTKLSLSAREDFERAVITIADMLRSGIASLKLSMNRPIRFQIDAERLAENEKELPLEVPAFRGIVDTEIASLLHAAVADNPERTLPNVIPDEILEEAGAVEELQERLVIVQEHLVSKGLRERILIHQTSKKDVLRAWDWEISVKQHDLEEGTLENIPYATIRMTFDRIPAEMVHPSFAPIPDNSPWIALVDQLEQATQEWIGVFEDWEQRLAGSLEIAQILAELEKRVRNQANKHLRWSINNLHDAIRFNYAEDLTLAQATAFREAVLSLKKSGLNTSREEYRQRRELLTNARFSLLPIDESLPQSR